MNKDAASRGLQILRGSDGGLDGPQRSHPPPLPVMGGSLANDPAGRCKEGGM